MEGIMKRLLVFILSFSLLFGLVACNSDAVNTRPLTEDQKELYDKLEAYELSASEGSEVYIWGGISFYVDGPYPGNLDTSLTSHENSDIAGYIDAQDNYGYIYTNRYDMYKGKIIDGRENQLLVSDFLDDSITTEELEMTNTRENFEELVKRLGYIFPDFGTYSKNHDDTVILVTTSLSKLIEKENDFVHNVLMLSDAEISNNQDTEIVLSFDFSVENRFEFHITATEFYIEGKYNRDVFFEYELIYLLRESMLDRNYENVPVFSFPSDYQDCDIAYKAGRYIDMKINANSNTYVKLSLDADTYSIHLAGNETLYNGINLYNEEMTLIEKNDGSYDIEEAGIYYLEIENTRNRTSVGRLFFARGESVEFKFRYGGNISGIAPVETRTITLINYIPEDGYLYFFGSSYFTFEIIYNEISYYTVKNGELFIPVSEGETAVITLISDNGEFGSGFTNWRFVLEEKSPYND